MRNSTEVLVSIICLTYNHEKYIQEALDGFVNQRTSFDYEIIVHDDASTDGTQKIVKEFEKKYPKLFNNIYQTENQHSKRKPVFRSLLQKAKGKYIAICEGDDYWIDVEKLEKQVSILEANPDCAACCCNELVIDGDGKPFKSQSLYYEAHDVKHDVSYLYDNCKFSHTAGLLIKKSIYPHDDDEKSNAYFKFRANGDMKWAALIAANGKMYHIAETMAVYRCVLKGGDSWSARNFGKNINLDTYNQLENIRNYFKEYYGFEISYQGYYNRLTKSAIIFCLKKPSHENRDIAKKLFWVTPHKLRFWLWLNGCLIRSVYNKMRTGKQ